ncbi:MAG: ABC transporter substrate-binding protein, partial [Turicibacter sp.]
MKRNLLGLMAISIGLLVGMDNGEKLGTTKVVAQPVTNTTIPLNDFLYVYGMDPQTFDYLYTFKHMDTLHLANFVDGLLEHDEYGQLIGALATSWECNEDATVWTFKLRENVNWYTDDGVEYAKVRANDFVAGLQHAADFQSQTLYLVQSLIAGLDDYVNDKVSFEDVGIKAIDDYTL